MSTSFTKSCPNLYVVLRRMLLPDIRAASGSEFFVFQQDSAPSHRAKDTVALLEQQTPDFIPPTLWPPNSPDLSPVHGLQHVECASAASISYRDLGCRRTERRIKNDWADVNHASLLLNMLLASGASDYALAFALRANRHFEYI